MSNQVAAKVIVPNLNMKAVVQTIFTKNKFLPKKSLSRPEHLKRYPNMKFNRNKIINFFYKPVGKLNFSDITSLPQKLRFEKRRIPSKVKEVMPPQHDYINFKNMTGNEILLNMMNFEHFRNGEMVNGLYEFSKRIHLPENREDKLLKETKWIKHSFVRPLYQKLIYRLPNLNLKHLIITVLAFDNLSNNHDIVTWKKMETSIDRMLHKLKPCDIVLLLEQLNKHPNRTSKEFLNKLLTIIPIHIENLKDEELLTLIKVCVNQDLVNERLFNYFIYPRLENRVKRFKIKNYIRVLSLLCDLHYQEDLEFWDLHILPGIFNFEYKHKQIKVLWETILKVKVSCPNVDISKHLLLIENVIKQFDNLKASGQDVEEILLKLEQDMSLVSSSKKKTFTQKEAKEFEKRLKDKAVLKQFMEKFNSTEDDESRASEAQININKLLEVKDWKKARYEINLVEMDKLKRQAEEDEIEVVPETVEATPTATKATTEGEVESKTAEVADITAPEVEVEAKSEQEQEKEDNYNMLNAKYLEKRAKKKKIEEKNQKK